MAHPARLVRLTCSLRHVDPPVSSTHGHPADRLDVVGTFVTPSPAIGAAAGGPLAIGSLMR